MLPLTIPIFPLPNVVLFPNVFLPLHIFEPRWCCCSPGMKRITRVVRLSSRSGAQV
jgi:Lon protease-like protein